MNRIISILLKILAVGMLLHSAFLILWSISESGLSAIHYLVDPKERVMVPGIILTYIIFPLELITSIGLLFPVNFIKKIWFYYSACFVAVHFIISRIHYLNIDPDIWHRFSTSNPCLSAIVYYTLVFCLSLICAFGNEASGRKKVIFLASLLVFIAINYQYYLVIMRALYRY